MCGYIYGILLSITECVGIYMEYYMDGPRDCHTEWSKSDRIRQISCNHLYVDSDINDANEWYNNIRIQMIQTDTNEFIKQKETYRK